MMKHRSLCYHLLVSLLVVISVLLHLPPPLEAFSPSAASSSRRGNDASQLRSQTDSSSNNFEELELLRKERRKEREHDEPLARKEIQADSSSQKKPIKAILSEPIGDLTPRDLASLCNSIRFVPQENSLWSLRILERILIEVNQWEDAQHYTKKTYVKKIHVFSVLTALSNGIQSRKAQRRRHNTAYKKKKKDSQALTSKDIERLKNVVHLLKELCREKRSIYCDADCYQKDVLSFATMIVADASTTEESAVDAALVFIDMMEEEINEWDTRVVGSVLNSLSNWGRADEAHALLSRAMGFDIPTDSTCSSLDESVNRDTNKSLNANEATPCYDAMLRAYSKHALLLRSSSSSKIIPASTDALTRARYILLNHMPNEGISITNHTCNAVLSGYSAMGLGSEAKQLLLEIEALHLSPLYSNQKLSSSLRTSILDTACYNSVLHGYSLEKNGVRSAEELLTAMKEQHPFPVSVQNITVIDVEEGSTSIKIVPPAPDMISYVSMLNCYGKNVMGREAYDLLLQIERPTSASYLATIRALQRCSDPTAPDKVLTLVEQLEMNRNDDGSVSKRRKRSTVTLNRQLFHASMQCMIRHGQGSKAEIILDLFNSHSTQDQNEIQPYILALKAYENTKAINSRREAAESAERLLRKMQSIGHLPRSIEAYKIVTNSFARAGMSASAIKLVKELDSIGIVAASEFYDLIIKAISLSDDKDAVSQAWAVLHQLGYPEKNAKDDVDPFDIPITTFNSMLKLFARRGMATEAEALLQAIDDFIIRGKSKGSGPDIKSYEAVLEALGKTNDSDAVERAEALITRVEVMSELGGSGVQQPSLKMYNNLLNVYGESGKVGSAERLLARLNEQSLKPDAFSYATTIKALKNSGKSKDIAVARAKELAQSLDDRSSNGARINEIIFAHRLSILAKFGVAAQAENLLQEMRLKHKTGELKQGPGVIHYTAVLNAWAKSDDKKNISRAERLFEKMKADPNLELDLAAYHGLLLNYSVRGISPKARQLLQTILDSETIQPNRNTFTMVIDSYSRSSSTANAGVKAEELLDQMRQLHAAGNANVEPDSVCYASVIRCKQASTSKPINELTVFDKLQLMRELQIENWPFQ